MSGAHALRHPLRKWVILLCSLALAAGVPWFLGGTRAHAAPSGRPAAAVAAVRAPDQDACHRTDNLTPRGDCGAFKQLYTDDFGKYGNVPVGAFKGCDDGNGYRCSGLKVKYPHYYATMGAYPEGWTDTAGHHGDGNSGPVPGVYRPDLTTSVYRTSTNDGQLRVHMYRSSSGGANKVAALVPVACRDLRFGKFTERLVVRTTTRGFKMAHLHYTPDEIDYPEAGGTFQYDPISWFDHGFDNYSRDVAPNASWRSFHTYSTEVVPGHVRVYFDGKLIADRHATYPEATPWVLQNESALGDVPGAVPGSSVNIDTTWITCYRYAP